MAELEPWQLPPAEFDALRIALGQVRAGLVADDDERMERLGGLIAWLNDDPLAVPPTAPVAGNSGAARLWALAQHLERYHDDAKALGDVVGAILLHASALAFFARTGLPGEGRLFSELFDRIARKVLPTPADDGDLAVVLQRGLSSRRFLKDAPAVVVVDLFALLEMHSPALQAGLDKVERDVRDAVSVLAVRVAHLGVAADMRRRGGAKDGELADYPFLDLPRWCDLVLERRQSSAELRDRIGAAQTCLRRCHGVLQKVHATMLSGSVSVDLVFRLDLVERQVSRLERLLTLIDPGADARAAVAVATVKELLDAGESDTSLKGLFADNTRLLARRIVEATGTTGEHYIAASAAEYRTMWWSAAAGGAFMAFVATQKFLLLWLKLPPFFAGFTTSMLYAGAFLTMQAFHMTLATKQPSMTAATLAAALDEHGRSGVHRLVDLITRTARTQFAAIAGNIGAIVPVTALLHFAILTLTDKPFLGATDADKALHSHHLWQSGSVFFAGLTGVFLWTSSVAGGWCDNWVRYRRLPEALATNRRIRNVIGVVAARRLAGIVERQGGGAFGSICFGLLLGLTPVVSSFFGVPLEIRHITISTATVVMGALSNFDGARLNSADLGWALAGLGGVALMNFTVSFSLALAIALRARDIDGRVFRLLVAAVLSRFMRRPWEFLLPPVERRKDETPPT